MRGNLQVSNPEADVGIQRRLVADRPALCCGNHFGFGLMLEVAARKRQGQQEARYADSFSHGTHSGTDKMNRSATTTKHNVALRRGGAEEQRSRGDWGWPLLLRSSAPRHLRLP